MVCDSALINGLMQFVHPHLNTLNDEGFVEHTSFLHLRDDQIVYNWCENNTRLDGIRLILWKRKVFSIVNYIHKDTTTYTGTSQDTLQKVLGPRPNSSDILHYQFIGQTWNLYRARTQMLFTFDPEEDRVTLLSSVLRKSTAQTKLEISQISSSSNRLVQYAIQLKALHENRLDCSVKAAVKLNLFSATWFQTNKSKTWSKTLSGMFNQIGLPEILLYELPAERASQTPNILQCYHFPI